MNKNRKMILLVGDNPFHGISHLSQERARIRGESATDPAYAANLVMTSVKNGADGFMFSVSDTTLSILRTIREQKGHEPIQLYALVPYAYEYVRLATQVGGIPGLARRFAKQVALSGNVAAIANGLKGIVRMDPAALMKAYLAYEISRIKSSAGNKGNLGSLLLHEIITDMALALDLDQIFKSYVDYLLKHAIRPGFETRNFPYLVDKFMEWGIGLDEITIATPFNRIGFQMNPSRIECEKALSHVSESTRIIAMSVLAAGYLKLPEAMEYIRGLTNLKGVVIGVSKEHHANETFKFLKLNK
jgi:uncharacterized protein (DUF486 family)